MGSVGRNKFDGSTRSNGPYWSNGLVGSGPMNLLGQIGTLKLEESVGTLDKCQSREFS